MMANKMRFVLLLSVLLLNVSCTKRLKPNEFIDWVNNEENELIHKQDIKGLQVKALYRPNTFIQLNELGPENLSAKQMIVESAETEGVQYYELIITKKNSDFIKEQSVNKDDYQNNLYYFSFNFKDDISLIYPGYDTLPVSLFHFERAYSLSDSKKFLLVFKDDGKEGDRVLHIDSPVLPSGVINLYFKNTAIKKASTIEIEL